MRMVRERKLAVFFALLVVLSLSVHSLLGDSFGGGVDANNASLSIGEFDCLSLVCAGQYVYLNWTVSDNNGQGDNVELYIGTF